SLAIIGFKSPPLSILASDAKIIFERKRSVWLVARSGFINLGEPITPWFISPPYSGISTVSLLLRVSNKFRDRLIQMTKTANVKNFVREKGESSRLLKSSRLGNFLFLRKEKKDDKYRFIKKK
ncbi:MAG TPA: hypothetical protein PLQ20_03095, partial [Candidatus Paceibacterota bacterium]|nr:hypothetical protein [Candidatus Paceibacterota bacterium]